jgi:hypothetical protein
MTFDWLEKWLEFKHKGKLIRLQGILPTESKELQEIFVEQLVKWDKGNELWVVVLLEPSSKPDSLIDSYMMKGIPVQVKSLIREFDTIFQEPSTLPPFRGYDHSITLFPNAAPINCRPYKYSLD